MRRFLHAFATGLLATGALGFVACSRRAETSPAPHAVDEPRELTADQQVQHVLNRLGFGPRPGDVAEVRSMGVDRWIARQLQPNSIDDRVTEQFLSQLPTLHMSSRELVERYPRPALVLAQARARGDSLSPVDTAELRRTARRSNSFVAELISSKVARAVMSERQLHEVMVDFWENHFTVFAGKGQTRYFLTEYDRDVIRPRALGNFRDLLGAVAKSPAMLFYLDNVQSVADSGRPVLRGGSTGFGVGRGGRRIRPGARPQLPTPNPQLARRARGLNENYARELLELHTLGVDGGYTQQDVIEVARALTGWTIRPPRLGGAGFLFRPEVHDAGEKRVLGATLASGRGIEDGEQVLDIVAAHPATARYIARKLAVRFVSDSPSQVLVDRAAATFTRTKGDIRETVRTIVTSGEFFSREAYRSKVKSPFEAVVSALRALDAQPDKTPRTAQLIARLGQPIFGHQAPDGYPETGAEWINTGAILNRINFGMAVAADRVPGATLARWPLTATLRSESRERQVDGVVAAVLGGSVSPDTRAVLMSGDHPMLSRAGSDTTDADVSKDEILSGESMTTDSADVERPRIERLRRREQGAGRSLGPVPQLTGLAQVVGLALGSPEFQRR